ncbi:nucleoporin protein Ndc1-Nup [Collybia nuda]|uniref:Nucleoporin protein Ndc1-Nup n=1 Tax=Collybia nuda TaxID=64659 RepID=A0A9P6CHV2_9AGAR|nr:nucleoporin protein Ndc1-Nup [Collybia nuda]
MATPQTTPIRAITTPLSSRSSPTIPPPTQFYEPFVKSVLRFRLVNRVFLYSAGLSWAHAVTWSLWGQGGLSELGAIGVCLLPFQPWTVVAALVIWVSAALPSAVLRKVFLTSTRTPSTSPSSSVSAALSKTSTTRALVTYALSAMAVTALHVSTAYANEPSIHGDSKLRIFVKSRKHPHYLNGRLLFLLSSQLFTALGYSLRNVMLDRVVFHSSNSTKSWSVTTVFRSLIIAVLFTSVTVTFSAVVFGLVRFALPLVYKLPILPFFLRPFTAHFLRGSWTILLPFQHVSLLMRAWFLGITTMFIWESTNALFDTFIPQPISISHLTPDPNLTLVSGLSSSDSTFRYFAYSELKELAADPSNSATTRRVTLFSDQKYSPSLWSRISRESLLLLGNDYQLFLRRGKSPPTVTPAPPAKPSTPVNPTIGTPTPLLRTPIYKSSKQSPIHTVMASLGSDGALARALDEGADATNIPELFRSVEAAVMPAPAKEEVKKNVDAATGIVTRINTDIWTSMSKVLQSMVPVWAAEAVTGVHVWWAKERVSKVVQGCLPNKEVDLAVIEALSHLTCASLVEDKYGVVQRDIPKILEAMLSFLSAIEEYQVEISALYVPPPQDKPLSAHETDEREALREEVERAGDILRFVGDGLKEGVARIVRTFGDKLLAFKFPPRTAQKLQGFLEYC